MFYFFFNDPATTEIYTLSLHDALPILWRQADVRYPPERAAAPRRASVEPLVRPAALVEMRRPASRRRPGAYTPAQDRKSTRLNSSHSQISYAVFCLKKKNIIPTHVCCF